MKLTDGQIKIDMNELAHMIAHKCRYCEYKEGRCSEKNGCEEGVLDYLFKLKDN